jgi:hypothetical protein
VTNVSRVLATGLAHPSPLSDPNHPERQANAPS